MILFTFDNRSTGGALWITFGRCDGYVTLKMIELCTLLEVTTCLRWIILWMFCLVLELDSLTVQAIEYLQTGTSFMMCQCFFGGFIQISSLNRWRCRILPADRRECIIFSATVRESISRRIPPISRRVRISQLQPTGLRQHASFWFTVNGRLHFEWWLMAYVCGEAVRFLGQPRR